VTGITRPQVEETNINLGVPCHLALVAHCVTVCAGVDLTSLFAISPHMKTKTSGCCYYWIST